ncbi:MAG: hypothetical protein HY738_13575 [Bacteroidia bacterium]|nr:hypothetical protein [Bacteroidia bacterium]
MITKNYIFYYIFICLLIFYSFRLSGQISVSIPEKEITGKFKIEGFNTKVELELKENGDFSRKKIIWSSYRGGTEEEVIGQYKISGNDIFFTPTYIINTTYFDDARKTSDTLKYKENLAVFRKKLTALGWNHKIYLLSEENISVWGDESPCDFIKFINNVNSGGKVQFVNELFWIRRCKSCYYSELSDVLPPKWKYYLLKKPVDAEIISVEKYPFDDEYKDIKSVVIINKGEQDGLKPGMKLYGLTDADCDCDLEIIEVTGNSSEGYSTVCISEPCKKGTKVSTFLYREAK